MAVIVHNHAVASGYNVTIDTAGERHVLHFPAPPTETIRNETIAQFESRLINAIDDILITTEDR